MSWQTMTSVVFLIGALVLGPAAIASDDARTLHFDVFMDDKEIGFHNFELGTDDEQQVVRTEAEFSVKILFITAFKYEHKNHEVWSDGCLRRIESSTNSNGKRFTVVGERENNEFVISEGDQTRSVDGCVSTFAYWDRQRLQSQQQLLNPQTGELVLVNISSPGKERLRFGDNDIDADVLQIRASDLDIKVLYDVQSGEWMGLESIVKSGRKLRYLRKPQDKATQVSLLAN